MVVITFVSEDVIVNENNGTTFVCVERSAVTEFNMSIFIDVTFGSADGKNSSFIETTMTIVSFAIESTSDWVLVGSLLSS